MKRNRIWILLVGVGLSVLSWADTHVRFIAANVTSGDEQSYDPGHGIREMRALCDAHDQSVPYAVVIGVQEFNYGDHSDEALGQMAREACGEDAIFYRENSSSPIPNGFIVRGLEILDSGYWVDQVTSNRGFAWIKVGLPNGQHFYAYSVHWSTRSEANRNRQATRFNELTDKHVPAGDARILMGDTNIKSSNESAWDQLKARYVDEWLPVDSQGKSGTNASRKERYDVVLANPVLEQYRVAVDLRRSKNEPAKEGVNVFSKGLVFDPFTFPEVEKNMPPAQKNDSKARNSQHRPVVRDFLIPDQGAFDCVREVAEAPITSKLRSSKRQGRRSR